ncbi:MAG TPA: hypothetical protein PK767_11670 [Clostridiales bacterium]|nr:hypothetical protein [Clostridiales bacterium]HOL92017.1 hypothetical protein [Clostridiales bacterium]HPP36880.1 hypothetical protein [Clostridiales bacterium]
MKNIKGSGIVWIMLAVVLLTASVTSCTGGNLGIADTPGGQTADNRQGRPRIM